MNAQQHLRAWTERLIAFCVRRPWTVVALHLVAFLGFGHFAGLVKVGVNVEDFFPREAESRRRYDRMAELFPDDSWGTILVSCPDPWRASVLRRVKACEDGLKTRELVYRTQSVLTVKEVWSRPHPGTGELQLTPEPLMSAEEPAERRREIWRNLGVDPRFRGNLVDTSRDILALRVQMIPAKKNDADARRAFRAIVLAASDALQTELREDAKGASGGGAPGEIRVIPTGLPIIRAAYVELVEADVALLMPVASLLTLIVLALLFRRVGDVVLPLLVVEVAIVWTLGTVGVMGKVLNQILQTVPLIILVVGVSDSIHLVHRVNDRLAEGEGPDFEPDLILACREMALACLLTSVTTIVGFLSLITTNIETIVDFGIITACGILWAFIVTITLLPALTSLRLRLRRFRGKDLRPPSTGASLPVAFVERIVDHRGAVLAGVTALALVAAFLCGWIDTTAYVFDDLSPETRTAKEIREADQLYSGILPLAVFFEGPQSELREPETLAAMARLRRGLTELPHIEVARSLDLVVRRANHVFFDLDPAMDRLPERRRVVSDFLLILPRDMGEEFQERDKAVVTARTMDLGSRRLRPLLAKVDGLIEREAPALAERGIAVSLTGTTPLVQEVYDSILGSLWSSVLASLIFMALLFRGLFGSLRAMVAALLPNILPMLLLAASLVLYGIPLKPSTVIIFSTAFGIAVDDTIHVIARFREERARGVARLLAIQRTATGTGAAVVTTSLVLAAGFLVLTLSSFDGLAHLGLLFATGLVAALLSDLVFLPALLAATDVEFGGVGQADPGAGR